MLLSKRRSIQLLFACLMAVGLLFSLSMATTAEGNAATINSVNYKLDNLMNDSEYLKNINVVANASAPIQYRQQRTGDAVCVEISPAVLGSDVKRNQDVNTGLLKSIAVSQTSADVVLVRMNVSNVPKTSSCTALAEGKGVSISLSRDEVASAEVTKALVAQASNAPAVKVAPKMAAPKAVAKAAPAKPAKVKVVNMEFVNADLVYIVKFLAKEMGRNVYVAPDVQGSVTVTLKNVRPEGALALVLKMQEPPYDYKIVDNTIIVGTTEKLATIADNILTPKTKSSAVRKNMAEQEFVLEAAPTAGVMDFLKGQYPDVIFTPHPTINGFYAKGTKDELLEIKGKLPNLDQVPPPPPTPRREYFSINYGKIDEIQGVVSTLVPGVSMSKDSR